MKTNTKKIKYYLLLSSLLIVAGIILITLTICLKAIFLPNKNGSMSDIAFSQKHSLAEEKKEYAKIKSDTPLLKNLTDKIATSNTYFLLPSGFNVKLISSQNYNNVNYSYVYYTGYYGYVKSEFLETNHSSSPNFLDSITITLKEDAGTHLRTSPEINQNNIIQILPPSQNNIKLIGYITAETPSDGTTPTWYYITLTISDTKVLSGYIYSERCLLSSPLPNQNQTEESNNPTSVEQNEPQTDNKLTSAPKIKINSASFWIILLLFCLPIIGIFIYLIIKPNSILKTSPNKEDKPKKPKDTKFQTDEFTSSLPPYRENKNEERYQTEYHFNGSTYEKKYILNEDEIEEFQDLPKSCLKKIKKEKKFKLVDRNSPFTTFEYTNQSQPSANSTHAITNETPSETTSSKESTETQTKPPKKNLLSTFFEKIKQESSSFKFTDK